MLCCVVHLSLLMTSQIIYLQQDQSSKTDRCTKEIQSVLCSDEKCEMEWGGASGFWMSRLWFTFVAATENFGCSFASDFFRLFERACSFFYSILCIGVANDPGRK